MKALDLFCGAGGASMGIHMAGFEVTGVDIKPQPHYPFKFIQADAMTFPLEGYDFIWASPPCQAFSPATLIHGKKHPNLLTSTRERLKVTDTPWIIENVPGAPMRADVVMCGSLIGQPRLKRHRLFEFWVPTLILLPSCSHADEIVSVFGHGGHIYHKLDEWREVMGIDWMNRDELAQAIPPAYSHFLCRHVMQALTLT